jgi:hypothetical protein
MCLVWWQLGFLPGVKLLPAYDKGLSYSMGPRSLDGGACTALLDFNLTNDAYLFVKP